jgi:uncharacterized protein (DUF1501 family)
MVPAFLYEAANAAGHESDARVLVVIQLEGGNDGINTIVPFADEGYARHRRELRIKSDELLKINDQIGLHPSMRGIAKLLEDGQLAIVQGVGYPNPNRSHFESMRIWQTAKFSTDGDDRGWIGKAFDELPWPRPGGPDAIYVGDSELPRALIGRRTDAAAIATADDLAMRMPQEMPAKQTAAPAQDISAFVRRSVLGAYGTARDLAKSTTQSSSAMYPDTKLAAQLRLISQFIKSNGGTRVYYAAQSSYDTHYAQLPQHAQLLGELSNALKAFMDDLNVSGLSNRVLVMCFSEFGRRVAENGSLGTDHGTAAPMFLAGGAVRAGLLGRMPSLMDLRQGDLKMSVDFRRVYAAILQDWLRVGSTEALAGDFAPLEIVRRA